MKKIFFICGCQDLYGEEVIAKVEKNAKTVAKYLNNKIGDVAEITYKRTVCNAEDCTDIFKRVVTDDECVGVIVWMHTFSPAKMWINGLQLLNKPLLHLHTQINEKLPYSSIDMDFMNLNQSAHGDREFGFICARLNLKRKIVSGYYKNEYVINEIRSFARVAKSIAFGKGMRVAMLGGNMRDVAVTDGDRVESEIKYGWNVNYYGIGDVAEIAESVTEEEIDAEMLYYKSKYDILTSDTNAVREQARYQLALEKFIDGNKIAAFTDTFQDLRGLKQLPGLAVQDIMSNGVGFAPEGDYKTSAMLAVMCKMSEGADGVTGFLEDYTYDLQYGCELELASHMLEVSPVFAASKPTIEVHPLGIGGKNPPARLVFDGIEGEAIAVSMVDMGNRFRIICAKVLLTSLPEPMPKLPVARVMWRILPDFKSGTEQWIRAGGAHHAVVSTAVSVGDIKLFAELTDTELITIGD